MKIKALWGNPFKKGGSDIETELAFIAKVPIFDSLSSRQVSKIHNLIHVRRFNEGEIVFRQNDPGAGMYIVRDGVVDVYNEYNDLTKHKITSFTEGDFFGDMSLLNESPRSATAVCARKTTLFGLFKPDLLFLMDSDPKLGLSIIYRISQFVCERLRLVALDDGE